MPENEISLSCLYDEVPYLLIEAPTGIFYSGQVCGMMCDHPQVEGFIIPLYHHDWKTLENSCDVACTRYGLDEKALSWLRERWPKSTRGSFWNIAIELDESRAAMGTEAWFPVRLRQIKEPRPYSWESRYSWLDGKQGFLLMYDNCD